MTRRALGLEDLRSLGEGIIAQELQRSDGRNASLRGELLGASGIAMGLRDRNVVVRILRILAEGDERKSGESTKTLATVREC
jgi:hypothetical protein